MCVHACAYVRVCVLHRRTNPFGETDDDCSSESDGEGFAKEFSQNDLTLMSSLFYHSMHILWCSTIVCVCVDSLLQQVFAVRLDRKSVV